MAAQAELHRPVRQSLTADQLRGRLNILSDQERIKRGETYDDILKSRAQKENLLGNHILTPVNILQKRVGNKISLLFDDPSKIITDEVMSRTQEIGLNLHAVPVFPFDNPGEMAAVLFGKTPSPIKELYGDYLRAAMLGAAPIDMNSHFVYIDQSGSKTGLSSLLEIEDLDSIDPRELARKIKTNGKKALRALGINSGAHIGVINLEEAQLSAALGDPIYGLTSTANHTASGKVEGYFALTKEGLIIVGSDEVSTSKFRPRLVIRIGELNTNPFYLNPPLDKIDPEVRKEIITRRTPSQETE